MSEIISSFTGVVRIYYDNERTKLKKEYFELNGKKNGIYKSYWENGILKSKVNYIDNMRNGIYNSYHNNGQYARDNWYITAHIHKSFELKKNHSKKYPCTDGDKCKVDECSYLY